MPDEPTPVRQQIDELRSSKAYQDNMHPSHEAAMRTIADLYSREFPEPDADPPKPEEVEGLKAEASEVQAEALTVDDPEAAKIQEELQPLRDEWQGDYDKNVEAAQGMTANLVKEYGIDAAEVFDVIGNDPLVVRNLFAWSRGEPGDDLSPEQAKALIGLLQKTDAYKSGASRTSETVQQITQALYKIAYGD